MINYNNSEVVQALRQYEMFANSLNLVREKEQRDMIIKQLTKLEEKIIDLTEEAYEEEYRELAGKQCDLFADEKNRINMLIELINGRLSYVEKRCNNHYELTGESINASEVLGASELDELENRGKIIDKYLKNKKLEKELEEEVDSLVNKINLASEKIEINKSLNIELETTFKKTIAEAIEKLGLHELEKMKDDIRYAYEETQKNLTLAGTNLEMAKTSPANVLVDCQEMYNEAMADYDKYCDQMCTLKLMEIYDQPVADYEELLNKRKRINEIVKYINNEELREAIVDMINKQFNTIMMEEQDINTYADLINEKERKLDVLKEIDEENNSEEFQSVLKELIENERMKQEKILEEQRKIEEEERKRKLEIERKKQEEILKRQRIIEEARKKEIEKRTKQMLEEQQNSILGGKRKENVVSFETIKDDSLEQEDEELDLDRIVNKYNLQEEEPSREIDEGMQFKNKVDIEKELFDEFNSRNIIEEPKEEVNEVAYNDIPTFDREIIEKSDETYSDNKFPDMSIDEYMRNFDESKVDNKPDIFADDEFPTIPM